MAGAWRTTKELEERRVVLDKAVKDYQAGKELKAIREEYEIQNSSEFYVHLRRFHPYIQKRRPVSKYKQRTKRGTRSDDLKLALSRYVTGERVTTIAQDLKLTEAQIYLELKNHPEIPRRIPSLVGSKNVHRPIPKVYEVRTPVAEVEPEEEFILGGDYEMYKATLSSINKLVGLMADSKRE